IVVLHVLAGILASVLLVRVLWRAFRTACFETKAGLLLLTAGAGVGLVLLYTGTSRPQWNLLYAHILLSLPGVGLLVGVGAARELGSAGPAIRIGRGAVSLGLLAVVASAAWYARQHLWRRGLTIQNPPLSSATMEGEGDGPKGPFFPS